MEQTSQIALHVTPTQIYLLMQGMEGASCHDEMDATPKEYRDLWDKLMTTLEEHDTGGDTLEEILG